MKNLIQSVVIFTLLFSFSDNLHAQRLKLNCWLTETDRSIAINQPIVEIYKDGKFSETIEVRKNKFKFKTTTEKPITIRIVKPGYDDIVFGIDYSTASPKDWFRIDIPLIMHKSGEGKGDEAHSIQWKYEPNSDPQMILEQTTVGELKAHIQIR